MNWLSLKETMAADISQLNLKQPIQVDWDNYNPGSRYTPPPPALGADDKAIVYTGILPKEVDFDADDAGNLVVKFDTITLRGGAADGYQIRFTRVSTKPFQKNGKEIPVHSLGNLLKSAGLVAKPQTNAEYVASVKSVLGKPVQFTIDWFAKGKETGEAIRGYKAFPIDPERPGQRKSVLQAGTEVNVLDQKGNPTGEKQVVQSEVLFANAQTRYFIDPSKK